MANEFLKYSYDVSLFADQEHCQQLLNDTGALGQHWTKITGEDTFPDSMRGIYLISLVSPYKLESHDKNYSFRNTLYIEKTEDLSSIYRASTLLPTEKLEQLTRIQEDIPLDNLRDLEFWFLPIPGLSMDLIDNLLTSLKKVFNPPYNPRAVKPVKASTVTNLSAPAF